MTSSSKNSRLQIDASSGIVKAILHPKSHWWRILLDVVFLAAFIFVCGEYLTKLPLSLRLAFGFVFFTMAFDLLYRACVTEIIEFSEHTLTIRKDVRGWERKREFAINECHDLEWKEGSKGQSSLCFKAGRNFINFGKELTENESIEILAALQQTLPDVAQQICVSSTDPYDNLTTLKLNP